MVLTSRREKSPLEYTYPRVGTNRSTQCVFNFLDQNGAAKKLAYLALSEVVGSAYIEDTTFSFQATINQFCRALIAKADSKHIQSVLKYLPPNTDPQLAYGCLCFDLIYHQAFCVMSIHRKSGGCNIL